MPELILNNGIAMPQLGFGTIQQFGEQITDNVAFALNNGYKLIDTANRYGNEVEVGLGLKNPGSSARNIFSKQSSVPPFTRTTALLTERLSGLVWTISI